MTDEQEILKLALELAEWKARAEKLEASIHSLETTIRHLKRSEEDAVELADKMVVRAEKLEAALRKAEPYIRMYHTDTYSGADDLAAVDDALKEQGQ